MDKYTLTTIIKAEEFKFHVMPDLTADQVMANMAKTGFLHPDRELSVEEWIKSGAEYPHRTKDFAGREVEIVRFE